MNRSHRFAAVSPAALLVAAGLALPAAAADKSWICNSGAWSSAACWSPAGMPGAGDIANLGDAPGVANQSVRLDLPGSALDVNISNGMTFRNDNFFFQAAEFTRVSGSNLVNTQLGPVLFRSTLSVSDAGPGPDYVCRHLFVSDDARVSLVGGGIRVNRLFMIDETSRLVGDGAVILSDTGTTFSNGGVINPDADDMYFTQIGGGDFDIDGPDGHGTLLLDAVDDVLLSFDGPRLSDAFSGDVYLARGTRLNMQIDEGWTADQASNFTIAGGAGQPPAEIGGTAFTFAGSLEALNAEADLIINSTSVTFAPNADLTIGDANRIDIASNAVLDGGAFILHEDARLDFDGPTEVRAGSISTFSTLFVEGYAAFNGATTWNGSLSVDGVARQVGDASVSGTSTITADVFDMDGNGSVAWDIAAPLTVNAAAINTAGTNFAGTLNIGGGLANRITMNIAPPATSWWMGGVINLTGNANLFFTRVAGSPMVVTGDLNITARVNIDADTTLGNSADISIPAAGVLRFLGPSAIGSGAAFVGNGAVQNGPNGAMLIHAGANTSDVGLINQGALRIGEGPGIVTVDRFENAATGVWHVEIGGPAAGAQHDRLFVVDAPASLAGRVEVQLIDAGAGVFHPSVGDTFTILTSVGGVLGAFAPTAETIVDGVRYEWIVASNANDVTVRLNRVMPPCRADFNVDGIVNSQDFFDFLTAFFAESTGADFNGDTLVNSQDFFDFLTAFFGGC